MSFICQHRAFFTIPYIGYVLYRVLYARIWRIYHRYFILGSPYIAARHCCHTRHYYTTGECHWVFGTSACTMNTLCHSRGLQPVMDVERLRITYIISANFFCVMQLITNESGKIVCSDTYQHEFPQVTSGILLDYIAKKVYDRFLQGALMEQYSLVYWTVMRRTITIGL